jgi:hypothetical protein
VSESHRYVNLVCAFEGRSKDGLIVGDTVRILAVKSGRDRLRLEMDTGSTAAAGARSPSRRVRQGTALRALGADLRRQWLRIEVDRSTDVFHQGSCCGKKQIKDWGL